MARMQPNGWKMPRVGSAEVAGGRARVRASNARTNFPRSTTMQPTALIHAQDRTKEIEEEFNTYLRSDPPPHLADKLFEAQQIIAGKHLVPLGLDRPEVFDVIRIKNKTWISYDGECVLDLKSESPLLLKQTCQDLYALIRDLRLTSERPTQRFIVQHPSPWIDNAEETQISMVTGSRPAVILENRPTKSCIVPIVDDLVPKMASHIMPIAMSLTGLDNELLMRISFGRLNLQKKKKAIGDQTSYVKLPGIMKSYVNRGAAILGSKLPIHNEADFPQLPEVREVLNRLTHETTGIRSNKKDVAMQHTLIITLQRDTGSDSFREIRVDMSKRELGKPFMRAVESWARLDWTVLAPDRQYDWNMKVTAREHIQTLPDDFLMLLRRATAKSIEDQEKKVFKVRTIEFRPETEVMQQRLDEQIKDIQIKTSALIPFEGEPYMAEVSVTQMRPGIKMTKPEISWGIEFYGSQWDECMNNLSPDGLRKDWGRGLASVWPNGNKYKVSAKNDGLEGFETRYGHFLSCVARTQASLEGLEIEELSDTLI